MIKVIWGSDWEKLFEKDTKGVLEKYLMAACDGDFQGYRSRGGGYMREKFFNQHPDLAKLVEDMSDDEIHALTRGGHDPVKVYAAYKAATEHKGQPTNFDQTVRLWHGSAGDSVTSPITKEIERRRIVLLP